MSSARDPVHALGAAGKRKRMLSFWQDCSRMLESELSPQQFAAWIKPLRAVEFDASTGNVHLRAPNRLKLDAIRMQFAARIQAVASAILKRPVNVLFEVESVDAGMPADAPDTVDAPEDETAIGDIPEMRAAPAPTTSSESLERARLNPDLTF